MSEGKIVEFIDQGRFVCALCLQDKGSRLHLLTPTNREVNLSPKRALLVSQASMDTLRSREELLERLRQREATRSKLKEQVDVKELWDLIRDEGRSFDHKYLAQLCFGESVTDDHLSALVRALFQDRLYFKLKDGQFVPNPEEKVEQIKTQRELEALQERRLQEGSAWLKGALEGKPVEAPACREEIVQSLVQLALYGNEAPDFKGGKELLARSGIFQVSRAREVLVRLGIWEEDENLDLMRMGLSGAFSEEVVQEASRLAEMEIPAEGYQDYRHLEVMTIDGPLTRDFDDAVSVELTGDAICLGLHVADVASVITPGSLVDRVAAERASSLYLPRRQIPMIPEELSQGSLSLKAGCERRAISLLARFDREGRLLEHCFVPSVIQVRRQLVYEDVDRVLEQDAALKEMYRLSQVLRENRNRQGALNLDRAELHFDFQEDGGFSIELIDQDTPSRGMIAEFMILYNWLVARFARDKQIPILYRAQAEPNERLSVGEEGYLFFLFQQLRKLNPARIDTHPGPHSGLGVDVYTHATSPLRRYLDLVVQRQIRNALLGQGPLCQEKDLEEIKLLTGPTIKGLQRIKRNRIRYWILKYLSRQKGRRYPALVLDLMKSRYRVVLPDFLLVAEMPKGNGMALSPGQLIQVEIKKVDPWEDVIELVYANNR